jgi:LmbE family N-acetylglucosaminyl deacetylase
MLRVSFDGPSSALRNILCLGAHCDDIEIGCGATILRLLDENPGLKITWVVLSSTPQRRKEALNAAKLFLNDTNRHRVLVKNFHDSYFPYQGGKIKDFVNSLKSDRPPDLIFTHYRGDLHQDHRLVSELTWNAFRDHVVLEYEIPKYDGDLGSPNLFVEVSESLANQKIRNIMAAFQSQATKAWFTDDTFRALLRIRGIEAASKKKFAEAFYCRKMLF